MTISTTPRPAVTPAAPNRSALRFMVLPHAAGYAIVYRVPGTSTYSVQATSASFELAVALATRLNDGGAE